MSWKSSFISVIQLKLELRWEMSNEKVGPPQEREMQIKIVASSLCHAEIFHLFEGEDKHGFPTVLGHEGAGVVESVQPGVTDFKPGHKIFYCKTKMCLKVRLTKSSGSLCPLPLELEDISNLTVYHLISLSDSRLHRTGRNLAVTPGSVCAVFGLGAVGLAAVMGCKNAGASRIFAVDINEQKFEKAKVFGATDFLDPKAYNKPISEVLAEMTNGGVDFSLESHFNSFKSFQYLNFLCSCVKGWGMSILVGYTDVDFSARQIQLISGKTWKGTLLGGKPAVVSDYMTGKIKLDYFITHKMDLEQTNDAINLMKTGQWYISHFFTSG
uniref:Alcohol dehydrogenase 8b n=1 Tax=Sinocyclocheilus grahami TaxID=75366 RepID=A0A672MNT7_SINGR